MLPSGRLRWGGPAGATEAGLTARRAEKFLYFPEQFLPAIWLRKYTEVLQLRSMPQAVVIQNAPQHEDPHLGALGSQVSSSVVTRQALNISSRNQQIGRSMIQPLHRLSQIAGCQHHVSRVFQFLRQHRTCNGIGNQQQDRRAQQGMIGHASSLTTAPAATVKTAPATVKTATALETASAMEAHSASTESPALEAAAMADKRSAADAYAMRMPAECRA
jgi:hypothetical protein